MKIQGLNLLVEDCITHNLSINESIDYIEERLKRRISTKTLWQHKKDITSDDSLNIYFNEHTRIGFVRDHRARTKEMKSVMNGLIRRWHKTKDDLSVDVHDLVRLSEGIISASKRLEEISLANPVISGIKAKVEASGSEPNPQESQSNITA